MSHVSNFSVNISAIFDSWDFIVECHEVISIFKSHGYSCEEKNVKLGIYVNLMISRNASCSFQKFQQCYALNINVSK